MKKRKMAVFPEDWPEPRLGHSKSGKARPILTFPEFLPNGAVWMWTRPTRISAKTAADTQAQPSTKWTAFAIPAPKIKKVKP